MFCRCYRTDVVERVFKVSVTLLLPLLSSFFRNFLPKREAYYGCVVEVGTSSNYRLGLVFRSRFRSTKERVTTPVLGLYVDLGFNSCVISCVVLLTMTSARLFFA